MSESPYVGAPSVALVVTAVAAAGVLAGTLRLAGGAFPPGAVVVPTRGGAVVAAVLEPDQAQTLGAAVSRVLREVPVVLLIRQEGQLSATRWVGGRAAETIAPGVLMASLDDVVEALLLGRTAPDQAAGAIDIARLGRWRAARLLAAGRRSG